ncbi:MAG: DUF2937 family protein [Chlamydiota bacterium]
MIDWFCKMIDRIFVVVFAIFLMQFPMFMEQYVTRLSGHVDELIYQVKQVEEIAKGSGKALPQFIEKFTTSEDEDFEKQGKLIHEMVQRKNKLASSLSAMVNANVISRPFIFLFRSDWEIAGATAESYQIGLSVSLESIVYGIVGVLLGYIVFQGLATFFSRFAEGLRRAKKREEASKAK